MQPSEKSVNSTVAILATTFMVTTAALGYVLFDYTWNANTLPKAAFICTKVEQVGKNLDDVRCVQYTHQKFYKEAVAMNTLNLK